MPVYVSIYFYLFLQRDSFIKIDLFGFKNTTELLKSICNIYITVAILSIKIAKLLLQFRK